ncbi:collagenase-like [Manduca sexta]|uniref:collagenase-like n=1 Tax=Manduca sexta TaxID=7130 RepID=UPI001184119E|nr:collagenase-like [Manduca sexta]
MLLIVLSLLAFASAEELVVLSAPSVFPAPSEGAPVLAAPLHYHEQVGVPEAARIRDEESRVMGRVAGGLGSYLGEHKFFAGLVISLTNGQTSVCGGSLISSNRVLTAATCWFDGQYQASAMLAVLGSVRLFSGGTRVSAASIAVHPRFNYYFFENNLAVLNIPYVSSTSYIRPIVMANTNLSYASYTAEIIGFGKTSPGSAITESQTLRDVFVQVLTNDVCRIYYGNLVEPEHMCTSGVGARGACGGDAGGPLILYSSAGNDVLIGVVNFWSSNGCASGYPSGHTRVAHHYNWIRAQL